MDKKYIRINNEVNKLLQNGLRLSLMFEDTGRPDLAQWVLAYTSQTAYKQIQATGLQDKLRDFWNDKKTLSRPD